jgi:hypothetical protein
MAIAPQIVCRNASTGCPGMAVERGYCISCAKENPKKPDSSRTPLRWKQHVNRDEVDLSYRHADWVRFSKTVRAYNTICQHIDADGVRCNRASEIAHHILSPRTAPTRRLDPRNVACLCHDHHYTTEGESSHSKRTLAPTRWREGIGPIVEYEHKLPQPLKPGEVRIGDDGRATIG